MKPSRFLCAHIPEVNLSNGSQGAFFIDRPRMAYLLRAARSRSAGNVQRSNYGAWLIKDSSHLLGMFRKSTLSM
jgi:hypothetical protein